MTGILTATVEVAGPFNIESKPYTMTIASKAVIAATDNAASTGTIESAAAKAASETPEAEPMSESAPAEVTPEAPIGEVEIPTTVNRNGNWRIVSVIVGIAVIATGLAIYKKKAPV